MILNKGFDQIVNPVDDQATSGLFLLLSRIAAIHPDRKDLLCLGAGQRQGNSAIRTNRVLAEPRASTAEPIHHEKNLAALRRHFHAEAWKTCVPVNRVLRRDRQAVDRGLSQADAGNGDLSSCYPVQI